MRGKQRAQLQHLSTASACGDYPASTPTHTHAAGTSCCRDGRRRRILLPLTEPPAAPSLCCHASLHVCGVLTAVKSTLLLQAVSVAA